MDDKSKNVMFHITMKHFYIKLPVSVRLLIIFPLKTWRT